MTEPADARLRSVFEGALELTDAARRNYLDRACGGDEELRRRVLAMLAAAEDEAGFLAQPTHGDGAAEARTGQETTEGVGATIGPYRLLQRIGEGGFGDVFLAEQSVPVERRVALKIIKVGMDTRQVVARFEQERQALARMDHPNIARVIDAGSTAAGRPYFVMDLVDGVPITQYCDEQRLGIRDRLELFAQVCTAVQHAHGKGIIHRDIKPSNVLVATQDGKALAKVIDFGIAKATDQKLTDKTLITEHRQVIGTLQYMSPEQAEGSADIDTRTDVYSLGALLYELLTGSTPFDAKTVEGAMFAEIWRVIREVDPPRPSKRLHESRETLIDVATRRGVEPRRLEIIVRGELDWIAMKALEKDRTRRYDTASSLALDIRRYLAGEAVVAVPPSAIYRLRTFVRRNKLPVAAIVAVGIALMAGLGIALYLRSNLATEVESVKRLSALRDYDELLLRVDELWPPHPDQIAAYHGWIEEAQRLVADLPLHRAKLKELRAAALPRSDEERIADRRSHPDLSRLERLPAQIAARRASLRARRDGIPVASVEPDWSAQPKDSSALTNASWALVTPGRQVFGREAEGLALARRALELADQAGNRAYAARAGNALAHALFALGRDEEALAASEAARNVATADQRKEYETRFETLRKLVAAASGPDGVRQEEAAIAALEAEQLQLEARVDERRTWRFAETNAGRQARWWHANLSRLIDLLEALQHPGTGLLSPAPDAIADAHGWSIPRRLALAQRLEAQMRPGTDWDRRWREAIAAIRELEVYGGLELAPQAGLVPLGPDPRSGLWEFWHVATGTEPTRGEDDRLVLTEETGAVLVLIPAGRFWMGASSDPDTEHNFDAQGVATEGPVHEVTLSPFLLSKYELTQGQWLRITGTNPSFYQPPFHLAPSLLHPVETVSWVDCRRQLTRMGLALPTEAQWEYACRAGTTTPWWTGRERESLRTANAVNLADQAGKRAGATWQGIADWPDFDDGFAAHAPVGTFAPNGWGLCDVHGNVWEWCADGYHPDFYGSGPRHDPHAPAEGAPARMCRGGSFNSEAAYVRSAYRAAQPPLHSADNTGVRPSRPL